MGQSRLILPKWLLHPSIHAPYRAVYFHNNRGRTTIFNRGRTTIFIGDVPRFSSPKNHWIPYQVRSDAMRCVARQYRKNQKQ